MGLFRDLKNAFKTKVLPVAKRELKKEVLKRLSKAANKRDNGEPRRG